ncbi:hypothetical protein [Dactylococcopsis salina]|uniref:Uncharacterized protein n=1 Tax=Dactylococcopsis salina (strain PCC 8305) TaxID=13035 RepID=K9YTY3_DACS8|nr:hypothetical protein [Dactylococcopsis salina]AFZ49800.1 hypothetical protein Dacsa_1095 [Dactylococcopsis salina PCC 8305]
MKEELILYKQAKQVRELAKTIVRDLLSVHLRRDQMSKSFRKQLEAKIDDLIARSQAIKGQLRQLDSDLDNN